MKKVVLMLIFTVSISLMSFTSTSEEVKKIDSLDECWSRKCIEHQGESYCTEWKQTDCSEWE